MEGAAFLTFPLRPIQTNRQQCMTSLLGQGHFNIPEALQNNEDRIKTGNGLLGEKLPLREELIILSRFVHWWLYNDIKHI